MVGRGDDQLVRAIAGAARPLDGGRDELDPILARIGDARFVLLGEASHGTHECYELRAALARTLIEERGFTAVAAEADWPDARRVNQVTAASDWDAPIGVIYRPETERMSHYVHTRLTEQFDVMIHLDHTRAVEPLDPIALPARVREGDPPETFPTGV